MRFFYLSLFLMTTILCVQAQDLFRDSILHDGLQRQYIVHLPPAYDPSSSSELLIVLHGGTSSAQAMMIYSGFNQISDTADFILVYPQGIITGYDVDNNPEHHWADGRASTLADIMGIDDVGFISSLIDTLSLAYSIDPNRIFATGGSNGGFMAQRLACQLSNKIAAVASVASTFPDSLIPYCEPSRPIPVLIMNGTADALVPTFTGGEMTIGAGGFVQSTDQMIELWRDNNNCSIAVDSTDLPDIDPSDNSTIRKYIYGDCSADTEIVLYKVFNGGHNLPGGAIQGPLSGNVNRDINGSVEIWRFFDQQTQTVLTSTSTVPKLPFDISIYPNPTAGWLHVQMSGDYSIEIFNAVGQSLVYSSNRAEVLDLSPLPDGLYYLKVANNRGEVTQKVVKRSSQF